MRKIWFVALIAIGGCSLLSSGHGGSGNSPNAGTNGKSGGQQGSALRLTLHKVMDTEGTGKLAGTFLLPDGYKSTELVKWLPGNYLTPVVGDINVKSDDGQVEMEWMSGLQTGFGHSPAGSSGIDPPKSVCSFLISTWKKEHPGQAFKVVAKKDTGIQSFWGNLPGGRTYANRGIVQLQYVKGDTKYHAKLHARIDVMSTIPQTTAIGGTLYEGSWVISSCYTVIAPEDKFPEAMKLFGIVLSSYRIDPHFYNTMMQASAIIEKNFYARQRQIMETSRIISQTNDEILDSMNKSYAASQARSEREVTGFDDYIRGIDRYQESDGEVSLPSGYSHAWSDGNGGYLVTDQPLYNPNVGGPSGDWHEMEKKQ